MTNYLRKMLNAASGEGFKFEVQGGGDEADYIGHHPAGAEEALVAVEEAELILFDAEGKKVAWALILPGLAPDEVVADCGAGDWIDKWWSRNAVAAA
jgi:hypothetical protein